MFKHSFWLDGSTAASQSEVMYARKSVLSNIYLICSYHSDTNPWLTILFIVQGNMSTTLSELSDFYEGNPLITDGFPSLRASSRELCCFLCCLSEQICWINNRVVGNMWCSCHFTVIWLAGNDIAKCIMSYKRRKWCNCWWANRISIISSRVTDIHTDHLHVSFWAGAQPANERRRYNITPSAIGRVHSLNDPCTYQFIRPQMGP